MTELAYAKINLILKVLGKRKDGYHDLESFLIPIELHDELTFKPADTLMVTSTVTIEDNSILKVATYMMDRFQIQTGVHIHLIKHIPIGAGLGGGSADIAATIRGLNKFFKLNLDFKTLNELANMFGSDTLFCLHNERAIIKGRGDHIEFVKDHAKLGDILLIVPPFSLLTKDVFKGYTQKSYIDFKESYNNFLYEYDESFLFNDLLRAASNVSKELDSYYLRLKQNNIRAHLTGSGSCFFMLNPTEVEIKKLKTMGINELILTKEL